MNDVFVQTYYCGHFSEAKLSKHDLQNLEKQDWKNDKVRLYHDQMGSFYAGKQKTHDCNEEQAINELCVLKKLGSHQNIVRYFTTCNCDARISHKILFELCDGNLDQYILDKVILPLTQLTSTHSRLQSAQSYFQINILNLLHQTTNGLSYLHENNIVHRDIKSTNVLLIKSNKDKTVAKLGGFGLSRSVENYYSSTVENCQVSSGAPPGQLYTVNATIECHIRGSKPSDVFDLGVMICYALTGKRSQQPREIKTNVEKRKEVFNSIRDLTCYTEEQKITMIDMIKRMTVDDPEKRLRVEEVQHHPSFYSDQKKINFLLTINDSVKKANSNFVARVISHYDIGLTTDNEEGKKERFEIIIEEIFKDYPYFLKMENNRPKKWQVIEKKMSNVEGLLKALRDKTAHACDKKTDLPPEFVKDFDITVDSYNPSKFLEVFFSKIPQLLIHLYEVYRNSGAAANFYPKK